MDLRGHAENEGYGARGISSGRMPHFGAILSSEQICQIMAYERSIENPPLSTAGDTDCVRGGVIVILASELTEKGLWYPTILGVLVVVAGVVLFCGSAYLLLGTNLGARLGFLVAFTGLMGFLMVLSLPLDHHRVAAEHAQGAHPRVGGATRSSTTSTSRRSPRSRDIDTKANVVDTAEAANVKAAVDEALVTKVEIPTAEAGGGRQRVRPVRAT